MTLQEITDTHSYARQFEIKDEAHIFNLSIMGHVSEWMPGDVEPSQVPMSNINNTDLAHMLIGIASRLLAQPHCHAIG
jgi:hypothetical protein